MTALKIAEVIRTDAFAQCLVNTGESTDEVITRHILSAFELDVILQVPASCLAGGVESRNICSSACTHLDPSIQWLNCCMTLIYTAV